MDHLTICHWVAVILVTASPLMGFARGIERNSVVHAALSIVIPLYGLVYFFAAAVSRRSPKKASLLDTIDTLPVRHAKWMVALFVLTAVNSLLAGSYLSYFGWCLALAASWVLAGFIEPVNKLKSTIGYKAIRTVIVLCVLPFLIANLTHQSVSDLLQTAIVTAKAYLP